MTNILGVATISLPTLRRAMQAHRLGDSPMLNWYWSIAHSEFGIDPAVAIAHAAHETGWFVSEWAQWHRNFCGLGVTGQGWGYAFTTVPAGVRAHCAHLLGYTHAPHSATCQSVDPRHSTVTLGNGHLNKIVTILDLDNAGWSADSSGYGTAIQAIYDAMKQA